MPKKDKKTKLRTSSDVISRLRWSEEIDPSSVMMGYTDRIEGPMETSVQDFVSAASGGDIPEHRITYFRQGQNILWDRAGRVDCIFGSGNGGNAAVARETYDAIQQAAATHTRIEQEREERRRRRARERTRRASKRGGFQLVQDINTQLAANGQASDLRFQWRSTPWFVCRQSEWVVGSSEQEQHVNPALNANRDITVVTWNVLFDLYDDGIEFDHGHEERWRLICYVLENTQADLISLQEVTGAFVRLICSLEWVQAGYACSASPAHVDSVSPSGVLILWRKSKMSPLDAGMGLYQCLDNRRSRSVIAALCHRELDQLVLFAAVHLPADQAQRPNGQRARRAIARKRELSSILGQLQRMEVGALKKCRRFEVTPVIAGDFNSQDDELHSSLFSASRGRGDGLYVDMFKDVGHGPGWTWDPSRNPRAARSAALVGSGDDPKRIDRIFIGTRDTSSCVYRLVAVDASLIGTSPDDNQQIPPSDHFGVRGTLRVAAKGPPATHIPRIRNQWAANAPLSPHYMLSVILDNPRLERLKTVHDPGSSLPLLHVTLLHGFVEADYGCMDLVKDVVQQSIRKCVAPPEALEFRPSLSHASALGVFEHRASATLVAHPDQQSDGSIWLEELYNTLRGSFTQCDEQERHSTTGWQPHVTLGVTGSPAAARDIQARWVQNCDWNPTFEKMTIRSMDVLKRGLSGKFHSIASFPLITRAPIEDIAEELFKNAGCFVAEQFDRRVAILVSRITRACNNAIQNATFVHVSGSSLLRAALPGISDVDLVVQLFQAKGSNSPTDDRDGKKHLLSKIFDALAEEVPSASARFRPANKNAVILTIRIPDFPSVDLAVYACDELGNALDKASQGCLDAIADANTILDVISRIGGADLVAAFQGALRMLKLWAHRNDVYGASTGFIGGGGWAVWLVRCMLDLTKERLRALNKKHPVQRAKGLLRYFFQQAAKSNIDNPIFWGLGSVDMECEEGHQHHPGNLVILGPCSKGNFGCNTTRSTSMTTLAALQSAANISQCCDVPRLLGIRSVTGFVSGFSNLICMELNHRGENIKPSELKAWGNQQFLRVIISLERMGGVGMLRPKARPVKLNKERLAEPMYDQNTTTMPFGFVWLIGLTLAEAGYITRIKEQVGKLDLDLQQSISSNFDPLGEEFQGTLRVHSTDENWADCYPTFLVRR